MRVTCEEINAFLPSVLVQHMIRYRAIQLMI